MTFEYISTSKAAVINVANKLAASEKTIAASQVSITIKEVAVVDKEKEMRVRSSGMSGLVMWW